VKPINIVFQARCLYGVLVLIAMAAQPTKLLGSGSYCLRPPRPPAGAVEDSQKYECGKAIFAGKVALSEQTKEQPRAQVQMQYIRLRQLQEKLPARVKKTVDLPNLAGRLSSEQLAALEYFLKVRYKVV
jgi:hypothetical protein